MTADTFLNRDFVRAGAERFVGGTASYVPNLSAPGALTACFVRSPVAHGHLRSLDMTAAQRPDGPAVAWLDGATSQLHTNPIPYKWSGSNHGYYPYWCLAVDKVLYAGDPIALVAAEDAHLARDAARLVRWDIDELPPYVDVEVAVNAPDQSAIHPQLGSNVLWQAVGLGGGDGESSYPTEALKVDVEELTAQVHRHPRSLRRRFRTARVSGMPLEGRGCLAEFDGEILRVWTSTQIPVMVRRILAEVLRLAESRIEVVAPDVGGGFGIKCAVSREEIAVCLLAVRSRCAVRWVEQSPEHLQNAPTGRDEVNYVDVAYSDSGKLVAMHVDCLSDVGAYSLAPLSSVVEAAALPVRLPAFYDLGAYTYRSRAVVTNKSSLGTYRGVAAPVGAFIMQRLLQEIAFDTGCDLVEVQRANLLPDGITQLNPAGIRYDPGQFSLALDQMLDALAYPNARTRQERARASSARDLLGVGMSALVEPSAVSMDGCGLRVVTDWEEAFVRVNPDGSAEVRIAASSSGQAHETTFAQIAGHVLRIDPRNIKVFGNNSASGLYGSGSWGSRVTVVSGGAVMSAAGQVVAKLISIGAHLLGTDRSDAELVEGGVRSKSSGSSVDLERLCSVAYFSMADLPEGTTPGLAGFASYRPASKFCSPYGWHGCVVRIDTITASVSIEKYVVVSDPGRIISPKLLDEQIRGGIAQGIGEALLERLDYDEKGRPLAKDLFTYRLPRAMDVPEVEIHHVTTPSAGNLLGVRGSGEDGPIGAPAALTTAIVDAFHPVGFSPWELPIPHAEIVEASQRWQAVVRGRLDAAPDATATVDTN